MITDLQLVLLARREHRPPRVAAPTLLIAHRCGGCIRGACRGIPKVHLSTRTACIGEGLMAMIVEDSRVLLLHDMVGLLMESAWKAPCLGEGDETDEYTSI